jgi:hypothetical protein
VVTPDEGRSARGRPAAENARRGPFDSGPKRSAQRVVRGGRVPPGGPYGQARRPRSHAVFAE